MFLIFFFTIVTLSQGICLLFARKIKNAAFREEFWRWHYPINGLLWILLFGWIIFIQFHEPDYFFSLLSKLFGALLLLCGITMSILGIKKLGLKQAMGFRFFRRQKLEWISGGTYSFLHNPIYDGFILMFLGAGLWGGLVINFQLALSSFLLLNIFLASIEKEKTKLSLKEIF